MDNTITQQRNRLQSVPVPPSSTDLSVGPNATNNIQPQSPPTERLSSTTTSFVNLFDGFTSSMTGERSNIGSPTSSSINATQNINSLGGTVNSIASITSIGSLGTTANAFYSSIGLAFNSLTSPITAAAAAASATIAAASALSNHLSSPTSGSPPLVAEEDDDCDDTDEDNQSKHLPAPTPRKSWSEISLTVVEMRKQLSILFSLVPLNVQFRLLSDGRIRCYFLSTPPNMWEATLLYTDINLLPSEEPITKDNSQINCVSSFPQHHLIPYGMDQECVNEYKHKRLQWNVLLQQPNHSGSSGTSNTWSREYQLLQERKRLSTWGITSYELHKLSGKVVFPCLSDLYQFLDTGYSSPPLFPTQLRTNPEWAALDPQICPQNSELIAYISGCDIWVTHTSSGHEERLTFAHDGRRPLSDDPLMAGVPSYVMQEEFSRYQGYWWQPTSEDGIYRIVYEEVDESDVCLYTFPSSQALPGEIEEYRFPRAGTPNAKSKLKMVQFMLNESLKISDVCTKDLPYSLTSVFPWVEYIIRVGWTPDSNYVWIQAMDRKQQRLDLVLIPLDNFYDSFSSSTSSPSDSSEHSWKKSYEHKFSPIQVLYSETSDVWINVHDLLYFIEINENAVTFLWASECTGFRHLYLITSALTKDSKNINGFIIQKNLIFNNITAHISDENMDNIDEYAYSPKILNKVALTSGEWEVLGRGLWIDKTQQLVYFHGLRDSPLEKHLYVVSLQRPEHIRLLTEPGYSYMVDFDESCKLMIQVYSNIETLPSSKIMQITQTCQSGGVNGLQVNLVGHLHEGGKADPKYCPQIYSPQLPCGEIVYAMVFKPHNFHHGIKYPTVLNVYGGPEVQTVNNTFKGKHQLRMHMLAAQGYCVVCIDSRGSRHRGIKFESHIRCRMGQMELTDQVDALKILADQLGFIDMNRVAIHGWSYGGYLSLMGLVQYPDIFKVAIAGAPVTNWELYDTGYTERYMDLPQNNKSGYTAGCVLNYIHGFPEEDNRLLLIHGVIDENVHFAHTAELVDALNKNNKPYSLLIFPKERHSLRNLESNKKYETQLLAFLQNL